jgi:hypothetical protein
MEIDQMKMNSHLCSTLFFVRASPRYCAPSPSIPLSLRSSVVSVCAKTEDKYEED